MPAIPHDPKADIQLIRNLLLRAGYEDGLPVLKELLQNADDAGSGDPAASAKNFWVVLAPHGLDGATHPLLRDRAGLCILNDGDFKETDATCLPMLGLSSKAAEQASVGKFGIGLKTVFFLSEVFFFFSHREEDWSEAKACELVNPWGPKHRQPWEEVWTDDARQKHRKLFRDWGTRILQQANSPDPTRFVGIWIPLRLKVDAQPDAIHAHYPTSSFDAVFGPRWAERVQEFMPLLRHVRNLRAQVLHQHGQLEEILRIAPAASGDAQFMRVGAGDLTGGFDLHVAAHDPTTLHFCGREFRETEEFGRRFQNHPNQHWPRQAVFGDAADQLERATPHGAVVFTRRPALDKTGRLVVQHAVFLPLSEAEQKKLPGTWDYCVFLHGFYFVDSSRRHIERYSDLPAAIDLDTVSSEEQIRKLWNRTLVREVIAPLMLPSLEAFVGQEGMDGAATGELVAALAGADTLTPLTKWICRGQRFIAGLEQEGNKWVRQTWAENGGTPPSWIELPVPGFPEPELFNLLPALKELSTELAVSLAGTPRLAEQKPTRPDDDQLARLLFCIPVSTFDNAGHLAFLLELVPMNAGQRLPDSPLTQALVSMANRAISRRLPADPTLAEHWSALFQRLPTKSIVRLPVESAKVSPEIAKPLAMATLPVALLWQDYRDAFGTGMIPWATLLPVLKQLSALVLDQEEAVKQRSDVAVRLLKAAEEQTEAWKPEIENLPLFASREPGGKVRATSLAQLQVAGTEGRLFTNGESCAQDLVKAAPELKPLLAVADVTAVLKLTGPNCDLAACVRLLKTASRLAADFARRKPLFERLLGEAHLNEQGAWATLRCLLHSEVPAWEKTATLFDETGAAPVLLKLLEKALAASKQPWRRLAAQVIGQLGLTAEHRKQLNLVSAADATTEALLQEVGPASVDCSGLSTEDCDFILERFNDVEVVRGLNIHETVDGDRVTIVPHTYVDDGTFTDLPAEFNALVMRLRDRPGYARFSNADGSNPLVNKLSWEAVIELALSQPNPCQCAGAILTAISHLGNPRAALCERVRAVAWLPLAEGSAVRPSDLVHVPGAETELDQLPPPILNGRVPLLRLAESVRNQDGFDTFKRTILSRNQEALDTVAGLLQHAAAWSTGLSGEWRAELISDWVKAMEGVPSASLPVAALVRAMHNEQDVRELMPGFLQSMSIGGQLGEAAYADVLKHLANRHVDVAVENRPPTERVFTRYLAAVASQGRDALTACLRRDGVRLLSKAGSWKSASQLAFPCGDLRDEDTVTDALTDILASLRPDRRALVIQPAGHQQLDDAAFDQLAVLTWETLRRYFKPWVEFVPQEMIGTFIATLGIHPAVIATARHFLGLRTIEEIRAELDDCAEGGAQGRFVDQVTHYTIACVGHDSLQANVLSLMHNRFPTELRGTSSTIFLGDGVEIQPIQLGHYCRHTLHLRRLDLNDFSPDQLFDLLRESTGVVLSRVYGLREIALTPLWKRLGQVAQLHIRIAQNRVVDAAQAFLRQVGAHQVAEVQAVLEDWNVADRRRAEAEEAGRQVTQAVHQQLSQAKRRLRDLLAGHPHTQQEILATVQRKINQDYGYEPLSVPFEIWQNADDAVVELALIGRDQDSAERLGFVLKADATGIAFAHWGRLVNEFRGADGRHFHDRHFDEDLEKMVVQAISDKRSGEQAGAAVTGKFGLGFKSVFLVSDAPEIVSGSVDFVIRGGIYPLRMDAVRRDELLEELKQLGPEHCRRGTIIRLPLRTDGQPNPDGVLALFERLAPLLVVFSRKLKRMRLRCEGQADRDVHWKPEQIADGIEVGELQGLDEEAPRALVFGVTTANDRLQLLLGLDSDGFVSLPDDVPVFWVTAPTRATPSYGFAVNGPFEPDVGRVQLAPQSEKNRQLAEDLAAALSNRLAALHAKTAANWDALRGVLQLASGTKASHFWESLWEVLARLFSGKCRKDDASPVAALTRRMLWESTADGLQAFYRQCAALPTGLWGDFGALTKLPALRFVADGALDREDVFKAVSQWSAFRNQVPAGAICSHRLVASTLTSLGVTLEAAQPVKLTDAVAWELSERRLADADLATRLGKLITPDFMKKLREGMPGEHNEQEQKALSELLSEVQFQAADGSWHKPTELVVAEGDGTDADEMLRAAFAPRECRLNPAYSGAAVAFFLACRPRLEANVETMAEWVLLAAGEERRAAALRYLLTGGLKERLAEELRRQRDDSKWVWQLQSSDWFRLEFPDESQRHEILSHCLRLFEEQFRLWAEAQQQREAKEEEAETPRPRWTVRQLWLWWEGQGKPTGDYTLEGEANKDLFHCGMLMEEEERKAELKRLFLSPDDPDGKDLWYRLFAYACLVSAGRTMTELREFWKDQLNAREFWERTREGDFSETTKEIFKEAVTARFTNLAAGGEQAYFWRRLFYDVRKVHRMVKNDFPAVILDLVNQGHGSHLPQFLRTGDLPGSDQRRWIGTFGQSADTPLRFIIRELVRLEVIANEEVRPFAFYVCRPVRRALWKIGWIPDSESFFSGEDWLAELAKDAEYGGMLLRDCDIPLLHMGITYRGDSMPVPPHE